MQPKKHMIKGVALDEISLIDGNLDEPANMHARAVLLKQKKSSDGYRTDEEKARRNANGSMKKSNEGDNIMDIEELQARLSEVEAEVVKQKERADVAEANVDAIVKSLEGTDVVVSKSKDGSVEVSTRMPEDMIEFNGERIAKSAVPEPILKHLEAQRVQLDELRKAKEMDDLRKSAEEAFPNLAGTADQKAKLMKALGNMDENDRDAVMKSLKAADAVVAKSFKEVGSTGSTAEEGTAKSQLEKMAKAHAGEKKVSYEEAFAEITKSGEGRELLVKSRSE
jgi:hypothetical protein